MNEGVSMDMEVGLIRKRFDEVEMICSMEELMNFVHQHELVEGDYGTHFTTNEVKKKIISFMFIAIILRSDFLILLE